MLVGTCEDLEKQYLRTASTNPSDIRPEHVLKESLNYVVEKSNKMTDDKRTLYLINQLRAMRQDAVVQQLKGSVVTDIYNKNINLAVEVSDSGEVASCLSALQDILDPSMSEYSLFACQRALFRALNHPVDHLSLASDVKNLILQGSNPCAQSVISFIVAEYSLCSFAVRNAFLVLPVCLQQFVSSFCSTYRIRTLEAYLQAAGPGSVSLSFLSNVLLFESDAHTVSFINSIITSECAAAIQEGGGNLPAKTTLASIRQHRLKINTRNDKQS